MATEHRKHSMNENQYRHLLIMGVLSFASMYVLTYAMVDAVENVFSSVNHSTWLDCYCKSFTGGGCGVTNCI